MFQQSFSFQRSLPLVSFCFSNLLPFSARSLSFLHVLLTFYLFSFLSQRIWYRYIAFINLMVAAYRCSMSASYMYLFKLVHTLHVMNMSMTCRKAVVPIIVASSLFSVRKSSARIFNNLDSLCMLACTRAPSRQP